MQGCTGLITHAEATPPLPPTAATVGVLDPIVFSRRWFASKRASRCGTLQKESFSGVVGVQPCLADAIGVWAHAVCKGR
jgi:hypothetical protein